MGINDEYSRDAYQFEQVWESDGEADDVDVELDPETWESLYSEEIFDGWTVFQEYIQSNYLTLKSNCTFTKFCDLVIHPSKYAHCNSPSENALNAWDNVKRVKIVRDRVEPDNFYAWFHAYVNFF